MNEFNDVLKKAEEEMRLLKHPYVGSEHLLLAILKSDSNIVKTLNKYNLNYLFAPNNLIYYIYMHFIIFYNFTNKNRRRIYRY